MSIANEMRACVLKELKKGIVHPNPLTPSEIKVLEICMEWIRSRLGLREKPTDYAKKYAITNDDVDAAIKCYISEHDNPKVPLTDEQIKWHCPYSVGWVDDSRYVRGKADGWIEGAKAMRDGKIK